jgi:hypothetical protein
MLYQFKPLRVAERLRDGRELLVKGLLRVAD